MTKILIGSRHGGHGAAVGAIKEKLLEEYPDAEFVVATDGEDHFEYNFADKKYSLPSFRSTGEDKSIKPLSLCLNGLKSVYILLKERPDVVVSAGANTSFPISLLGGWLLRRKVIAVEAINRSQVPSKTPSVLAKMYKSTEVWVSFDSMVDEYPTENVVNKRILESQDFDSFKSEEKDSDVLVVPSSADSEEIWEQYGMSLPHDEFLEQLGKTDTVITRAGNTSYEAAVLSNRVVVVPYPDPQGHQHNFAEWLEENYENVEVRWDESFEEVIEEY